MPSISCPHCKHSLTVNPMLAGQIVNCPACNQRVRLPATIPAAPSATAPPRPPQPAFPLPTFPAAAASSLPAPAAILIPSSVSTPQPMPLPAASFPAPVPKEGVGNVEVDTSARGIPFRAREYPALKVVMYVLYGFAILTACSFIISEILLIAGGTLGLFSGSSDSDATSSLRRSSSALAAGGVMAFLLAQAITIGYHAIAALWFVASAEMIRVFLDIQSNTHEAAHFVRQSFDRRSR